MYAENGAYGYGHNTQYTRNERELYDDIETSKYIRKITIHAHSQRRNEFANFVVLYYYYYFCFFFLLCFYFKSLFCTSASAERQQTNEHEKHETALAKSFECGDKISLIPFSQCAEPHQSCNSSALFFWSINNEPPNKTKQKKNTRNKYINGM